MGRCSPWETYYRQPDTHGEAQVMLQETLRKEVVQVPPLPATYTTMSSDVCLCSALADRSLLGATPAFPLSQHNRGAALARRERHFRSAGKSTAQRLGFGEIWGQGKVRLQDSNPCCSEFSLQNIFLIHTYVPAATYRVFLFPGSLMLHAKCSRFLLFKVLKINCSLTTP